MYDDLMIFRIMIMKIFLFFNEKVFVISQERERERESKGDVVIVIAYSVEL